MINILAIVLSLTAAGLAGVLLAVKVKKDRKRRWYQNQLRPVRG